MPRVTDRPMIERVIVFTRFPEAGKVKTRLIPALGAPGAASLHRRLAERTVRAVRTLQRRRSCDLEICYDGANRDQMREWLGEGCQFTAQGSGDLGNRMAEAFSLAFSQGAKRVLLVGTDCPGLDATILENGLESLVGTDAVLGPALDGGYYLIGLSRPAPSLFADMAWGENSVLAVTRDRLAEQGLTSVDVARLRDIDRPEDLHEVGSLCGEERICPIIY